MATTPVKVTNSELTMSHMATTPGKGINSEHLNIIHSHTSYLAKAYQATMWNKFKVDVKDLSFHK